MMDPAASEFILASDTRAETNKDRPDPAGTPDVGHPCQLLIEYQCIEDGGFACGTLGSLPLAHGRVLTHVTNCDYGRQIIQD